jgi:6-pyruvoyltetrahydropterin/6-carboxytetrahydropterin synthase
MRCVIERDYEFEAAHRLPKVPPDHKCFRVHGHSYRLVVRVEGEVHSETGWVMDFAAIDEHVAPVVAELDHHLLNEIEGLANPTCELLGGWLWQRLGPAMPGLVEIEIAETRDSRCRIRRPS